MNAKDSNFVEDVFVGMVGVPLLFLGATGLWYGRGR